MLSGTAVCMSLSAFAVTGFWEVTAQNEAHTKAVVYIL